jgi:signal transduction histidine kinase/predicted transcriptional regulator
MNFNISYKMIVWALVTTSVLLAGGYFMISYIYKIQEENNRLIEENVQNARVAKELKLSLYSIRAASLTYLFDRSPERIADLQQKQNEFLNLLEKSKETTKSTEANLLFQRISALFSNYQQTLKNALELHRMGRISQPNALIVHASNDLIKTIDENADNFIIANENAQAELRVSILKNDYIIRKATMALGIGGAVLGLILGWFIARIIINPIYKLVLKVRDAAGSEMVEHIRMSPGKELEELDEHINRLIRRINKAHEDLQKNRLLLEQSNKFAAIGKIAPALAHEIRNPLTSVKLLIYTMMQEEDLSREKLHDFEIISHEISRVEGFLQKFLKYARPAKPQIQSVEIEPVIQEVLYLMSAQLKQNNIQVMENYSTKGSFIQVDPDMIKQILMNLVLNAIESMGNKGEMSILTRIKPDQKNKQFLELSISDSGPGIPQEIVDTLFDPFVKGKDQGIGLGLSISQRIAEQHQGWISAANNSGKGASFTIHLPVKQ